VSGSRAQLVTTTPGRWPRTCGGSPTATRNRGGGEQRLVRAPVAAGHGPLRRKRPAGRPRSAGASPLSTPGRRRRGSGPDGLDAQPAGPLGAQPAEHPRNGGGLAVQDEPAGAIARLVVPAARFVGPAARFEVAGSSSRGRPCPRRHGHASRQGSAGDLSRLDRGQRQVPQDPARRLRDERPVVAGVDDRLHTGAPAARRAACSASGADDEEAPAAMSSMSASPAPGTGTAWWSSSVPSRSQRAGRARRRHQASSRAPQTRPAAGSTTVNRARRPEPGRRRTDPLRSTRAAADADRVRRPACRAFPGTVEAVEDEGKVHGSTPGPSSVTLKDGGRRRGRGWRAALVRRVHRFDATTTCRPRREL